MKHITRIMIPFVASFTIAHAQARNQDDTRFHAIHEPSNPCAKARSHPQKRLPNA